MSASPASPPGLVALMGSGETAAAGRRVIGRVLARLAEPRDVVVLDSPAGFQPNHRAVAEKVARFIEERLGEHHPRARVVETRREAVGTPAAEAALRAIAEARCIVAGPGSPTYMLRELRDTPYLDAARTAHRRGAALCTASAATVALGAYSVPVYEIFKAGEPPAWREGFDLLAPYGMRLALVPHWNNREGGADVDTSRCYLGAERFAGLRGQLPGDVIVLGIDEHTGCILDFAADTAAVVGTGGVHILRDSREYGVPTGASFPLALLRREGDAGAADWARMSAAEAADDGLAATSVAGDEAEADGGEVEAATPGDTAGPDAALVEALLAIRSDLRGARQWAFADRIRDALTDAGITVEDTPGGPRWQRRDDAEPSA